MSYPICYIKNNLNEEKTLKGKDFIGYEEFKIDDLERVSWASDDSVLISIANQNFIIGNGPSSYPYPSISDQIDWLKNY